MLFTNATIITMNPSRDILTDGAIAIEGNRIVAVGKTSDLERRFGGCLRHWEPGSPSN